MKSTPTIRARRHPIEAASREAGARYARHP
jgi:hypothetical protein